MRMCAGRNTYWDRLAKPKCADPARALQTKLIGESKFVQNNPPKFVPEEGK